MQRTLADDGAGSTMPSSDLLAAIREFTTTILNPYDLGDLLHRLTDHANIVTGSQGAGVMLAGSDGLGSAAASDDQVIEIELLQDRIQSGACHRAYTSDELVIVDDLTARKEWPDYVELALELGFRSVIGVPMRACGETIGVLSLYRRTPGPWSEADIECAEIVTAMGAGYVLHANRLRAQHHLAGRLEAALGSRDVIGQAKGLLMARHGVGARDAFAMLRTTSNEHRLGLREAAARLLADERTGPTP